MAEREVHVTVIVTGGAGFVGSAVVRRLIRKTDEAVVNIDKLTYAGNLDSLAGARNDPRHMLERVDICDAAAVARIFAQHRPRAVMHLAAETHVDRAIDGPSDFITANVVGTFTLLNAARDYWGGLDGAARDQFRFLHVSTDEVFGSLGDTGLFTEETPYSPTSPYSASKAASDHLVRAWGKTYGLPIVVTNSSNNYGPYQFPEKLIPVLILKGLKGEALPIYGKGENVRDWLHVEDHAEALCLVLERGRLGETYNIGGNAERQNIEVARAVCAAMDELMPDSPNAPHASLIEFVTDRPGHDYRYAMDTSKIARDLGWRARKKFKSCLGDTVAWYLNNRQWWESILSGDYNAERQGLGPNAGQEATR
jgi:dTDP-glucose 4,6-dehydratase